MLLSAMLSYRVIYLPRSYCWRVCTFTARHWQHQLNPNFSQCPECQLELNNNCELMDHLFAHVAPAPEGASGPSAPCRYCLARFPGEDGLEAHLKQEHPSDTKTPDLYTYACLICEVRGRLCCTFSRSCRKNCKDVVLSLRADLHTGFLS